jgi:hypothetical protein
MAEDASITNRRMKLYLVWLASCGVMIVFQPLVKWPVSLVELFLQQTGLATMVLIGGLSATDAVNAYSSTKCK